jgi:hypothetical protein
MRRSPDTGAARCCPSNPACRSCNWLLVSSNASTEGNAMTVYGNATSPPNVLAMVPLVRAARPHAGTRKKERKKEMKERKKRKKEEERKKKKERHHRAARPHAATSPVLDQRGNGL